MLKQFSLPVAIVIIAVLSQVTTSGFADENKDNTSWLFSTELSVPMTGSRGWAPVESQVVIDGHRNTGDHFPFPLINVRLFYK